MPRREVESVSWIGVGQVDVARHFRPLRCMLKLLEQMVRG